MPDTPHTYHAIDAHHHLWNYSAAEYGWIGETMQSLRRDFSMDDYLRVCSEVGVEASIAVQARQTVEETEWLLDIAERHATVAGVVGWIPLASPDVQRYLERFAGNRSLCGLRHVIEDEEDPDFILDPAFNRGVDMVREYNLTYDILVRASQLEQTAAFVERHAGQRFVLDHMAKPNIRDGAFDDWAKNITRLAQHETVFCKLSGIVTEAVWDRWTVDDLRPYADHVLQSFGASRVVFGSDWPVCTVAAPYRRWYETVMELLSAVPTHERAAILRDNAIRAYNLTPA